MPPEKPVLSSRPEMREAIRENREEQKTRSEAARPKGRGPRERSRGERKGQEGQREGRWQESGEVEDKGSAIMKSGYEDAANLVSRQPLFPEISTSATFSGD